jgi:hypothetical protein
MLAHGELSRVGVEGAGHGVGLLRCLRGAAVVVVEVDRPNRQTRARLGKSDPIDAYAAAHAVLAGTRRGRPKSRDGMVEAIRAPRVTRRSAVKARTQTVDQLKALLLTGPASLREEDLRLRTPALVAACCRLRVTGALRDPAQATRLNGRRRLPRCRSARIERWRRTAALQLAVEVPEILDRNARHQAFREHEFQRCTGMYRSPRPGRPPERISRNA